jgi:hypothetical protein
MTRIVTTTYRYKPPPKRKGRKLAEITGPAVVTSVDPRRGSRRRDDQGDGQGATAAGQSTRLERADQQQPSTAPERQRDPVVTTARKAPAPATDGGPRRSAIVTAKEKPPRPVPAVDLPLTRTPVERDGDDYKRMRDAMARRLRGE